MAWNRKRRVRLAKGLWLGRLVGVSLVVACLSLWYVWLRVQMVNIGYQIRDKERRLLTLKKENQVLRMKIAQMKSPKNIEGMIRSRQLDLKATKNWQMVMLPRLAAPDSFWNGMPRTPDPSLLDTMRRAEPTPRVPMN